VSDWAWPFLEDHLRTVLPGERVFRGLDRWAVGDDHRQRLRALALEGYRLHDARHHWVIAATKIKARLFTVVIPSQQGLGLFLSCSASLLICLASVRPVRGTCRRVGSTCGDLL
jgi:hypothetical protein